MKNARVTQKEWGLIKSALRRVFARSELHQQVMKEGAIEHFDEARPRCRFYGWCQVCGTVTPRWLLVVDHLETFVEIGKNFTDYTLDEALDRLWCPLSNLQRICKECHSRKSKTEAAQRAALRPKSPKKVKNAKNG